MAQTIKRPFKSFNGTDWDVHHFETSADVVKLATGIAGLTGDNAQAILQALKNYVDTHKSSGDHDSRYYIKNSWISSKAESGYIKFPNGIIVQWGSARPTVVASSWFDAVITYPMAFPNMACAIISNVNSFDYSTNMISAINSQFAGTSNSGGTLKGNINQPGDFTGKGVHATWIAIGY